MEVWKEKHCKRCPHCKRVIHKMSGCDAMICGNDAHGGNEQRCCGKQFSWTAAPAYSADLRNAAGAQGEEGESAAVERRLQLDAKEAHFVCAGSPLLCDGCGDAITGPRMQCMQCVGAIELCIGCVAKVRPISLRSSEPCAGVMGRLPTAPRTLCPWQVSRGNLELRDGSKHPKGHVFRRLRQPPLVGGGHSGEIDLSGGSSSTQIDLSGGSSSKCIDLSDGGSESSRIDFSGASSSRGIDPSAGGWVGSPDRAGGEVSARARAKRPAPRVTTLDLTDDDACDAFAAAATLAAVGSSGGRAPPVATGAPTRGVYDLTGDVVDLTQAPTAQARSGRRGVAGVVAVREESSSSDEDEPLSRRRRLGERSRAPADGSADLDEGADEGEVVWLS